MLKLLKLDGLVECRVVGRVGRFVVTVEVGGMSALAHLTNTGRLAEYLVPGRRGLCTTIGGPRLRYRLVAVEDVGGYAIVDTLTQSRVFEHLVSGGLLPWLSPACRVSRRNFRLGSEVVDYALECPEGPRLVELKSAVLRIGRYASYPDCPTARGRRQVRALADSARVYRPLVVFTASLPGVSAFKPNRSGDPEMPGVLKHALERGVELRAVSFYLADDGWVVLENADLPVELD